MSDSLKTGKAHHALPPSVGSACRHEREVERLTAENIRLRRALSEVVKNLGNGSAAAPMASLDFLCVAVPNEVKLYCEYLRHAPNAEVRRGPGNSNETAMAPGRRLN